MDGPGGDQAKAGGGLTGVGNERKREGAGALHSLRGQLATCPGSPRPLGVTPGLLAIDGRLAKGGGEKASRLNRQRPERHKNSSVPRDR